MTVRHFFSSSVSNTRYIHNLFCISPMGKVGSDSTIKLSEKP